MSQDPEQDPPVEAERPTCYLHPDRQALLRCSRCERPICADDAIEAPVGYQCPRCAGGEQPVRRMVDVAQQAPVTRAIVGVIAVLFLLSSTAPEVISTYGLQPVLLVPQGVELLAAITDGYAPTALARAVGEPWLLITSGFLHANLMHVGFNGLLLWQLGHLLEPLLGRGRYLSLYAAGLAGGGLGVLLVSLLSTVAGLSGVEFVSQFLGGNPFQTTIGASGAVFGLMGAAMVVLRARGVNPWRTSIGTLVLLNLGLTFLFPNISVGGHVGGLVAGALAGKLLLVSRDRAGSRRNLVFASTAAMLVAAVGFGGIIVAAIST